MSLRGTDAGKEFLDVLLGDRGSKAANDKLVSGGSQRGLRLAGFRLARLRLLGLALCHDLG